MVGGPGQPAVDVHRGHLHGATAPQPLGVGRGSRAPQQGQRPERRQAQLLPQPALPAAPTGPGRPDWPPAGPRARGSGSAPVPGHRRRARPTSRAARARRASVSSPAANLGASRCWSMSRNATSPARLTRCRAASVPTTSRASAPWPGSVVAVISEASTPARAESSSTARVTPMRSDFNLVESHTAQTAGRLSPHLRQCRPPAAWSWTTGPPQRVQRARAPQWAQASSRMRPVRLRMHTTRPSPCSSSGADRTDQALGEQPGAGIVPGAVDHLDDRPSPTFHRSGRGHQPVSVCQRHRRARRDQDHRPSVPSAPLDHHVDRRPGRSAFLPVGLIVGVEHHGGPQAIQGGPGRHPGAHHHPASGGGLLPLIGKEGHG